MDDLCLLGFVSLADPVRDSAPPAAAKLRDAGVQTVMITGDHPAAARAVAGQVNGDVAGFTVLTGGEIAELSDEELAETLPDVDVIARCPAQKVRIIQVYQRIGKVVAMTGDSANDAPAIRLADVGIALGRRGTPAARAAATWWSPTIGWRRSSARWSRAGRCGRRCARHSASCWAATSARSRSPCSAPR
ncbi:HAD family hydrolase [Actinophytocola sp.]|uniref:HAD family hydrolase n=1 Tax=Actinophytocola sp. TaxID=1872138 RepID=UPI003D6BFA09